MRFDPRSFAKQNRRGDAERINIMLLLGLLIGGIIFFVGWVMGNITAFLYIRHCCATGIYKTKKEIYRIIKIKHGNSWRAKQNAGTRERIVTL